MGEAKPRILESNLLSERYTNGKWVEFNRRLLLSSCLRKSDMEISAILDLGCGEGRYSTLMLKYGSRSRLLVGVDINREFVNKARISNSLGSVVFLVADGQKLPFRSGSFDWAIAKDLLHHVKHPLEVLREISRVSRKEVVVVEANRYNPIMLLHEKYGKHQHLTTQQLERLTHGFELRFSLKQVHAYPFTLRVPSFNPMACFWNASASIFLIACNKVPNLSEVVCRTFSHLFVPSFNVLSTAVDSS